MLKDRSSIPNLYNLLFGDSYRKIMMRPQNVPWRYSFLPYTGTCTPGDKIAVSPEGKLHCCERVSNSFPIGNIHNGLNMDKIVEIVRDYRKGITDQCEGCPITRLCPVCFARVSGEDKFNRSPSDLCKNIQKDTKKTFSRLWSLFEEGVDPADILHNQTINKSTSCIEDVPIT